MFFPPSPFLVRHVALGRVRVRVYRPRRWRPKPRRRPRWKLLESLRRTEGWRRKPQSHRFSHVSCADTCRGTSSWRVTYTVPKFHDPYRIPLKHLCWGWQQKKGFCRFSGWISRCVSLIPKKTYARCWHPHAGAWKEEVCSDEGGDLRRSSQPWWVGWSKSFPPRWGSRWVQSNSFGSCWWAHEGLWNWGHFDRWLN